MEEDGVGPLIEAKRKIEATMQVYLDKVAVLRKKSRGIDCGGERTSVQRS